MYAGLSIEQGTYVRVQTHNRPYTSVTSQKKKTNRQTDRAGRTGMAPTGDQNPLKTQQLTETQKVIKPIKHPKNPLKP
jgi:hypothetical protein